MRKGINWCDKVLCFKNSITSILTMQGTKLSVQSISTNNFYKIYSKKIKEMHTVAPKKSLFKMFTFHCISHKTPLSQQVHSNICHFATSADFAAAM